MEVPRCQTLYVNNINEKVKKEELRRSLYYLFSQFGAIMDVVALKTQKMRGQAFVVFRDISSATNALRSLQAFPFYDKPMRLAYARGKSDAIRRLDGTMGEKDKKAREKRKADESGKGRPSKRPKASDKAPASGASASHTAEKDVPAASEDVPAAGDESPNKILFVTNLPQETNDVMLSMLFQQFPGFKEVRLVPGRSDIAFIEFESEGQAGTAQTALQGFKITPTNAMSVTYAKK